MQIRKERELALDHIHPAQALRLLAPLCTHDKSRFMALSNLALMALEESVRQKRRTIKQLIFSSCITHNCQVYIFMQVFIRIGSND